MERRKPGRFKDPMLGSSQLPAQRARTVQERKEHHARHVNEQRGPLVQDEPREMNKSGFYVNYTIYIISTAI